ncbi:MAG: RNA polymerase sigma factor [Bacteroidetes bacterium]|uniref:RNA polymerase sigma factor n=1 Tax=Candidatus Merdivivens pullistercoris TaxID=2840873 RepID=A0A9D9I366_9BACT|nr:RNA polymerase sigma factor [Candidatus Merdivivens pullistercoris]
MGKKALGDKDLIIKALQNDQTAFRTLYDRHKSGLYTHISKYVQGREDIEDLCQESFRKAFEQLSTYNPEYKFTTWLYSIGAHAALDYLKRQKNDVMASPLATQADDKEMISLTPEEELVIVEMAEEVKKCLKSLQDIYRKPAELRFLKEYGYEEIAKELGIPLNTVKIRIMRAKVALITMLKDTKHK